MEADIDGTQSKIKIYNFLLQNSSGLRSDSSPPHACGVAKAEATVSSNGEGCNACGNQDDQKDSSPSQGYR